MKNKILIVLVVIVLIALFFLFKSPNTEKSQENVLSEEKMESLEEESTLSEIVSRGIDYRCTFEHEYEGGKTSGEVFISKGKIRGDFTSMVEQMNTNVESHMIRDNEWTYTWSTFSPQGFKVSSVDLLEREGNNNSSSQDFDYDQKLNYSCDKWNVDSNVFELPTNITFVEVG